MKKLISVLLVVLLVGTLMTGCGSNLANKKSDDKLSIVTTIFPEYDWAREITKGNDNVDLTALSSTMVYSEVYNMMYYPDDYRGKVVKMHGVYNAYEDSTTGETYYACIISDATACCAQGMEFLPPALVYPDDFPEQGTEVTITGVYETYTEGEYMYCRLGNARMEY